MNTTALNSLADLICRAQKNGKRTPMGIAMAIDSAGRHMSPEVAAELEQLRVRVAELEAERHVTNEALSEAAEALRENRDQFAALERQTAGAPRPVMVSPRKPVEDPHDSPLHHSYRLGRDLPLDGVQ